MPRERWVTLKNEEENAHHSKENTDLMQMEIQYEA